MPFIIIIPFHKKYFCTIANSFNLTENLIYICATTNNKHNAFTCHSIYYNIIISKNIIQV